MVRLDIFRFINSISSLTYLTMFGNGRGRGGLGRQNVNHGLHS